MRTSRAWGLERLESRQLLAATGMVHERGSFGQEIERLRGLVLARDSDAYVAPTGEELDDFAQLASLLDSGDLAAAATQAAMLDYELVEFHDVDEGEIYYELRERLEDGAPTRGWGTFVLNPAHRSASLIEAPHPLFEFQVPAIAAGTFVQSGARGLLMAGAHRHANGPGTADVAHLSESIFQTVHEVWIGDGSVDSAWQIHGFDADNHAFPTGTDVILSNGDGGIGPEITALDAGFENAGFLSYAFTSLASDDPRNLQVNDGLDGESFSALAATTNVQGIHGRAVGRTFVHVELEADVRTDLGRRTQAATILADALAGPDRFFVRSTSLSAGDDGLWMTVDFSHAVDPLTLSATDLLVNGDVGASSVSMVDADTASFALIDLEPGWYTMAFQNTAARSSTGTELNSYLSTFTVADPALERRFYVADTGDNEMFSYDSAFKLVVDHELSGGNTRPRGVATALAQDATWVLDDDDNVYVYDDAGNARGSWKARGLSRPEGIATDGVDIWIVDRGVDRVYRYAGAAQRRAGAASPTAYFTLETDNRSPRGITTDGASIWVVNAAATDKVFRYAIDGTPHGSWAIDPANANPRGVTIDPRDVDAIWIVDNGSDSIYQYSHGAFRRWGSQTADLVVPLAPGNGNPQGIADPPRGRDWATPPEFQLALPSSVTMTKHGDRDDTSTEIEPPGLPATSPATFVRRPNPAFGPAVPRNLADFPLDPPTAGSVEEQRGVGPADSELGLSAAARGSAFWPFALPTYF